MPRQNVENRFMKSLAKVLGGKKAKSQGQSFENRFYDEAVFCGFKIMQIPMGARMIRGYGGRPKMIPVKTSFDFVLGKPNDKNLVIFIDTKTIQAGNFTQSMIKEHQVNDLRDFESIGHIAGYCVYFRNKNKVVFFKASQLFELSRGESLTDEDGILLGDIFKIDARRLLT